ncbi:MAG: cytochrome c3 family protein [Candidatus Hydrothermae bacterium]|nr:cytochrome c3 family protein [Candidatus Hydrothermae bacterium]
MRGYPFWMILSALVLTAGPLHAEVKNTCVTCHEEQKDEDPDLAAPVFDWQTSIHFENGISCSDCHGGNPRAEDEDVAMSEEAGFVGAPDPQEVPDFCGKCHSAVRDNYMQSAHADALMEDESGPSCVDCHTAHKQQKATLDLINEDLCSQCHDYDQAAKLKEAMRSMDQDLTLMDHRVERLFREGLDVESEQKALFALRNRAHRLTHVLDLDRILSELGAVRADLGALDKRVQKGEHIVQSRRRLGMVMILFFLIGALLAWIYHKELMREAHKSQH